MATRTALWVDHRCAIGQSTAPVQVELRPGTILDATRSGPKAARGAAVDMASWGISDGASENGFHPVRLLEVESVNVGDGDVHVE